MVMDNTGMMGNTSDALVTVGGRTRPRNTPRTPTASNTAQHDLPQMAGPQTGMRPTTSAVTSRNLNAGATGGTLYRSNQGKMSPAAGRGLTNAQPRGPAARARMTGAGGGAFRGKTNTSGRH